MTRIRTYSKLFAVLILAAVLTACSKSAPSPKETLPTAKVSIRVINSQSHTSTEPAMGTVRPKLRATLEAKIAGRIDQLAVVQGQHVKKGNLVAQLDLREVRAKLDQAVATRVQSARDWERVQVLFREHSATQSDYDAAESRNRSAQAAVAELEAMLGFGKISAPFDGIITRKVADVGDLAAPGKPLVEIEQPDSLRFEANVPESFISRIQQDDTLTVRLPAMGKTVDAKVSEIGPVIDPDSRTFLVKLDLPRSADLRSGFFGYLDVPVEKASWLTVPDSAVVQRGQMEIVFVVTNNTAHLRLVKTGKRSADSVEILSGISSGESVVLADASSLVDGQPIETK